MSSLRPWILVAAGLLCLGACVPALAGGVDVFSAPGVDVKLTGADQRDDLATALKVVLGMTVLTLAPSILVCMTSFVRISIVLSLLRHAIGLPETPSNTVIVSLSLFLTLFSMSGVIDEIKTSAYEPYMSKSIDATHAVDAGIKPLREFMLRQTRQEDLAVMAEAAHRPIPADLQQVGMLQIIPAFMISELRAAFQVSFVVFLPFLMIDIIVATILMALGMMMVPPTTISLPLKVLVFVLVGGWHLVVRALLGTIH